MRTLILKDTKIPKDELLALLDEYTDFSESVLDITPTFWVEQVDFSNVPTVPDSDGDLKPTFEYRQALLKGIHDRYGDYGVDDVYMFVHEDNFLYKGIWGTAWSYVHFKYNFMLCRWDKDSKVNSLYTMIHEGTHPNDTTILKEIGWDINPMLKDWILEGNTTPEDIEYVTQNGFNWDRDFVHGKLPSVQYIGQKGYTLSETNTKIMKRIASYLKKAYQIREEKHLKKIGLMKQVITLLSTLVSLLKKQKGVQ